VKGEHKLEDPIVKAKQEFAEQIAVASGMQYKIIGGQEA
jgi:type III restriction enzyme